MAKFIILEPHLYAREGKRVTSYFTQAMGQYIPLGRNLEKAREKLAALLGHENNEDTIEAMCAGFIKDQRERIKAGDKTALDPLTVRQYERMLNGHVKTKFGKMRPRDFKPAHKAQYLAMRKKGNPEKDMKPAAIGANREMAALGSAFEWGMANDKVDFNPCQGVRRNKERARTRKPEISEVNEFIEFAKKRSKASFMAAIIGVVVGISGRRRGEFIRLTKSAVTAQGLECIDSKTKSGDPERRYLVEWTPILRAVIIEASKVWTKKSGDERVPVATLYLFPSRSGEPYTDDGFSSNWNKLQQAWEAAGHERFRAHDLRALYVSEMMDRGNDPNTHRNKETQQRVYDRRKVIKVKTL